MDQHADTPDQHEVYTPGTGNFSPRPPSPTGRRKSTLWVLLGTGLVVGAVSGGAIVGSATGLFAGHTSYSTSNPSSGNGTAPIKPTTSVPSQSNTNISGSVSTNSPSLNVAQIASRIDASVVDINTTLGAAGATYGQAAGTGMVLTSSGEILTNNHVIAGASSIQVHVPGKSQVFNATVLGVDPTADVALLKLQGASGLHPISLGSSSTVALGQPVVAIGNALGLGGSPTVTNGIVSGMGRSITASDPGGAVEHLSNLIQTDAPINPGNSGGPLVNSSGMVIGMDTAAATGSSAQPASNVGFAIPINRALSVVNQIRLGQSSSTVILSQPGFLGVGTQSINPYSASQLGLANVSGALIMQVVPNSPAANAGLGQGDVIVRVDGKQISDSAQLRQAIEAHSPGSVVKLSWVGPQGPQSGSARLAAGPAL